MDKASDRLREHFSFAYNDFLEPIQWSDGVGLSRIKKFSDGFASLYKIGIRDIQFQKEDTRKKLSITVSHGQETSGGISLGSNKKGISSPIDFSSREDFSYDVSTDKFYKLGAEVSPQSILSNLEEIHLRPTKKVRGIIVRSRLLFWRKALPFLLTWFDLFLVFLLWLISGERINRDILDRLIGTGSDKPHEPIESSEVKFEESKKMEFFGYKAKRWSVVFYCLLHLGIFGLGYWEQIKYPWLVTVFSNNFLALCYVVVSFATTEALMPRALKSMIYKITPQTFGFISFKNIKV